MPALKHLNFEYDFERRRYGATGTMKFYTWLKYRVPADPAKPNATPWQSFGDPWPKPRLNKKELEAALDEILTRTIPIGSRVQTVNGQAIIAGTDRLDNGRTCFLANFEYSAAVTGASAMKLHPGNISEVIA